MLSTVKQPYVVETDHYTWQICHLENIGEEECDHPTIFETWQLSNNNDDLCASKRKAIHPQCINPIPYPCRTYFLQHLSSPGNVLLKTDNLSASFYDRTFLKGFPYNSLTLTQCFILKFTSFVGFNGLILLLDENVTTSLNFVDNNLKGSE